MFDSPKSGIIGPAWAALIPILLSLIVGLYLQAGIIRGHALNEDYAAYLQEAQNIASHRPVNDMQVEYYFDPNLEISQQGPPSYPMLLPALYALPVAIFGYDIELLKELRLALLVAGLMLFAYAMRSWGFTALEIAVSLIVVGLSNPIKYSVNSIDADLPFLFFLVVALLAIEKASRAPPKAAMSWGIVMGVVIYLSTELRTVGIVLLAAAWLVDAIRHRRILTVGVSAAALAFGAMWGAQHALIGTTESYGGLLANGRFLTPIENLQQFYWAMANNWRDSNQAVLVLLLAVVGLAGVGVISELIRGSAAAAFLVCYTLLLLVLPDFDAGSRYLIPHLLFLGAFACRGASVIGGLLAKRTRPISNYAAMASAVVAVLLFSLSDRAYPAGLANVGTSAPASQEVFAYLKQTVPAEALVSMTKFRSFHLFTGHRTIKLLATKKTDELSGWLRDKKIDYVVVKYTPTKPEITFSDCPASPLCTADQPVRDAEEIWHNSDYRVFRLRKQ
jgi:hypothetical protein